MSEIYGHQKGCNARRSMFEHARESHRQTRRIFIVEKDDDSAQDGEQRENPQPITAVQGFTHGNFNAFPNNKKKKSGTRVTTDENNKMKSLMTTFFQKSSIYALNQIGNSQTTRRKIFWALILIGGLIGCASQIYQYLSTYYTYPVVVNIDSVSVFNQYFPAVTVCNLNNIQKKFQPCLWDSINYQECRMQENNEQITQDLKFNLELLPCLRHQNATLADEVLQLMKLSTLYFSISNESRVRYGHQPEEFIQSCSFNGEECSYTNFKLHTDSVFGNCYSFNKVAKDEDPLRTAFVGPNSGLTLELDVQSKEYSWMTKSVGARVVIHDPYQEPFPQEQGINVSPGFETILGLSKTMMVRLPDPYKDHCKPYGNGESQKQCNMECFQEQTAKKCGCNLYKKKKKSDRLCDLTDSTDICCVYNARREQEEPCYCPLECESSNYEIKISSAIWPLSERTVGLDDPLEEIRETRLKVKVYFDTLEQLIYQQKPMFDDAEVLSQIGGQMGLWLGLSLAAMFECVENAVLLWYYKRK